jgi:coenzyme F420 hydrogenase subunit beta
MNSITKIKAHRGDGWPGNLLYKIGNDEEYRKIPYSEYPDEFFESWQPWRCWLCLDRTAQAADITLGDAWLKELKDDRDGSSIIIARTDKGVELIEDAIRQGFISGYEVQTEKVLESQPGLWWEIEHKVKAYLQMARLLKLNMPQYDIQLENPGWKNAFSGVKKLLRMALLRRISASKILYVFYTFAQNIRQKI